jgi:hypothetical protein
MTRPPRTIDELLAQRVREFQSLPVDERVRQMFAIIEMNRFLIRISPDREMIEELDRISHEEWRRRQLELFARFGLIDDGANKADQPLVVQDRPA